MNVGESNDVNLVLDYFLGRTDPRFRRVDHALAGAAGARLADRAHKTLMAGLTGDQVIAAMVATHPPEAEVSRAEERGWPFKPFRWKRAVRDFSDGLQVVLQWNDEGTTVFIFDEGGPASVHHFHAAEFAELARIVAIAAADGDGEPDAHEKTPHLPGACRVCGCTWNNPCPDGCSWVEDDLCSACAEGGPNVEPY